MKRSQKVFLALGLMVVFALAVYAQAAAQKVEQSKIAVVTQRVAIPRPCNAPNLAAGRPTISKRITGGVAYLDITAKVTNIGGKDFISSPNQAAARLVVKLDWLSGPAAYVQLQSVPIARLNVNQAIDLRGTYQVPLFVRWDCVIHTGECCRDIEAIVMVSYDPDILMDGNLNNDDCNFNNDRCANVPANHVKYIVECPW